MPKTKEEEKELKYFEPDKVDFSRIWHTGFIASKFNDCLPLAINHAMGCMWFKKREQVQEIIKHTKHLRAEKAAEAKALNGLCIHNFKDMLCDLK